MNFSIMKIGRVTPSRKKNTQKGQKTKQQNNKTNKRTNKKWETLSKGSDECKQAFVLHEVGTLA